MNETTTRGFERERELDRECGEVTGAILAVAGGRISQIVLCNLRHCVPILEALRREADELAVDLALVARPDGRGYDIAVRRR